MRRTKTRPAHPTARQAGSAELQQSKHAEELMELAVEAAQSRDLPDFLEQFALRSTRMLDAIWGGVAVYCGRETQLHAMPGSGGTTEAGAEWLISCARASQNDVETRTIPKEIAAGMPLPEEPGAIVFVRIAASDNERLGTLCLIRSEERRVGKEGRSRWSREEYETERRKWT